MVPVPKNKKISIERILPSELSRYGDFVAGAKFKSYAQFPEIPAQSLRELFFDELEGIKDSSLTIFLAMNKSVPVGILSLHKLNWDTKHFGLPMGKIRHILGVMDESGDFEAKQLLVRAATREFSRMGIRHISVRLSADDFNAIYALERQKYYLADTLAEYYFDYRSGLKPRETGHLCRMRLYKDSDFKQVQSSVKDIFKGYMDRFHRDPNLDQAKADQLYVDWLLNSCKGMAEDVILATVDGQIAGITTLEVHHKLNAILPFTVGEVALTGVVPRFRGKKVYTSMINFAQNYFRGKIDMFRYATQLENFQAQKTLMGLGFSLKYAFHTFHYYF